MSFIGLATVIVFISGKLWPRYESAIWAVFLIAVAFYMCIRLRQPVNYKSIVISEETIEYVGLGSRDVIRLDAIAKLEFVREEAVFPDLYGPYLEPKWVIQTASGAHVEIMDEWPHRMQLLRTFRKHLPGFDAAAAKTGFKARREGRWLCSPAATHLDREPARSKISHAERSGAQSVEA